MGSRCSCGAGGGSGCSCALEAGTGINVTGAGTLGDPWVVSSDGAPGDGWGLAGNAAVGGEKLGTTNSNPLRFFSNNVKRVEIAATGSTTIQPDGTGTVTAAATVQGFVGAAHPQLTSYAALFTAGNRANPTAQPVSFIGIGKVDTAGKVEASVDGGDNGDTSVILEAGYTAKTKIQANKGTDPGFATLEVGDSTVYSAATDSGGGTQVSVVAADAGSSYGMKFLITEGVDSRFLEINHTGVLLNGLVPDPSAAYGAYTPGVHYFAFASPLAADGAQPAGHYLTTGRIVLERVGTDLQMQLVNRAGSVVVVLDTVGLALNVATGNYEIV